MGAKLYSYYDFNDLSNLRYLIDNGQAKITFWGARVMTSFYAKEGIHLDLFSEKLYFKSQESQLSPSERIDGLKITRKLQNFYKITDNQLKNSNFFTRFLHWLRNFECFPGSMQTPRHMADMDTEIKFLSYDEVTFQREFGGTSEQFQQSTHPDINPAGSITYASRHRIHSLTVKESALQAKLVSLKI